MFKQTKKGKSDERKGRKANKSTITSNSGIKQVAMGSHHQEGTQPDEQAEKALNNQETYPFSESFLDPDFLGQFLDQNTNEILKNEIGTTSKEEPQNIEYLAEKPPNPFKSERKRGKFAGSFSPKKRGSFRNFFSKQKTSMSFKDLVENNQTLDPLRQIQSENNGQDKQRYHEREMETFFVKREVGDPKTHQTWRDFSELFGYNVDKDNQSSVLSVDTAFNLSSCPPQNSLQKKPSRVSILKNIKSYFKPQQEKVENASDDTLLTPIGPATIIKHSSDSNKKLYQHPFKNSGPKKVDASAIDFHDFEFLRSSEDELFKPGNAKVSRCSYPDCRDRSNNSKLLCTLGTNQSSCSNYLPKKKSDSKQSNVIESKGDGRFDNRKALPPSYGAKNVSSECRKSTVPVGSFQKFEQAPDSSLPPKPTQSEVVQNSTIIKPIRKRKISGCNLKIKTEAEAEELEGTSGPVFENFFVTEKQARKSRSPTSNHSLSKANPTEISSNAHLSGHNIVDKTIQQQKDSKLVVPAKLQIGKSVLKKSNSVSPTRFSRKKNYLVFKTKNRAPPNTANSTSAFKKFSRNDDSKAVNDRQVHDTSAMYPVSDTQSLVSWHSRTSKKVFHVVNQSRYGRGRGRPTFSGMDKLDKRRSDIKGFKKYQINDEFPRKVGRITPDSPQISMKEESFETLKSNTLKQFGIGIGRGKKPKDKISIQEQESNSGLGVEIMNNLKRWRERNSPCFLHELLQASDQKPVSKNNQNLEIIMEEKFSSPNQPDKQEV